MSQPNSHGMPMARRFGRRLSQGSSLLGLLAVMATVAHGAPEDRKTLVLHGRILGPQNQPIAGAQVTVDGGRRAHASANGDGEYELPLRLGKVADLARKPMALRVRAERRGWRLALGSGEAEIVLDLRVVAGNNGVATCEVRASPDSVGSAVVAALSAEGDVTVWTTVDFAGARVDDHAAARARTPTAAELPLVGRVELVGVSVRSVAPPAVVRAEAPKPKEAEPRRQDHLEPPERETKPIPLADSVAATPPRAATSHRDHVPAPSGRDAGPAMRPDTARVLPPPASPETLAIDSTGSARRASPASDRGTTSPVRPPPDAEPRARAAPLVIRSTGIPSRESSRGAAGSDSCACHIEGTVEVSSDRPLPERARVVVALVRHPANADTVDLFMGSPRAFRLSPAPCGPQRLRIINLDRVRFNVTPRQAMAGFQCLAGAHRQFQLVLVPR